MRFATCLCRFGVAWFVAAGWSCQFDDRVLTPDDGGGGAASQDGSAGGQADPADANGMIVDVGTSPDAAQPADLDSATAPDHLDSITDAGLDISASQQDTGASFDAASSGDSTAGEGFVDLDSGATQPDSELPSDSGMVGQDSTPGHDGSEKDTGTTEAAIDGAPIDTGPACASSAPNVPRPIAPANGAYTGSLIAAPTQPTLRPSFRWSAVGADDGCIKYHLQVDDGCTLGNIQSCAFTNPLINAQGLTSTSFRPESNLPVNTTIRPVGRRYFWRVRACRVGVCSAFSPVRYVDVGRVPSDFDGNGFSDLAIASASGPWSGSEKRTGVFVAMGPIPNGLTTVPPLAGTVPDAGNDKFGTTLAVGDLNGDGYADLVAGATRRALIYLGGQDGIVSTRVSSITTGSGRDEVYGASAASGDWNADGFADVAIGSSWYDGTSAGSAYVYYGTTAGLNSLPGVVLNSTLPVEQSRYGEFGLALATAGDMDGDGTEDLVVGAPFTNTEKNSTGVAFVFRGAPTGLGTIPWAVLTGGAAEVAYRRFGNSLSAGDINDDGCSDLAVAQANPATVKLYLGGTNPPTDTSMTVLDPPDDVATGQVLLAVGDFNNDKRPDLAAAGLQSATTMVFYGGGKDWTPTTSLTGSVWPGDFNGDGVSDLAVGVSGSSKVGVFFGNVQGLPNTPSATLQPRCSGCGTGFGAHLARVETHEPGLLPWFQD